MVDPNHIKSSNVRQVFEYWRGKKSGPLLPSRADIEPSELKALSNCTFLVDVLRSPLRFRVRFFGTSLVIWAGCDLTGLLIHEPEASAPLRPWRQIFHEYRSVVESRQPRYDEHSMEWGKEHQRFERIIAPLSRDGEAVDMLLGALDLHATPTFEAASREQASHDIEGDVRRHATQRTTPWNTARGRT